MRLGVLGRPSLTRRLVLLAVGWSFAALVIAAMVLALLFQQAALRRFEQTLDVLVDNLIAGATVENGELVAPPFTDARALRAYSGRYWAIAEANAAGELRTVVPSRSLWDSDLRLPRSLHRRLKADPSRPIAFDTGGTLPGERLRAVAPRTAVRSTGTCRPSWSGRRPPSSCWAPDWWARW
jgi:hypothetical protein